MPATQLRIDRKSHKRRPRIERRASERTREKPLAQAAAPRGKQERRRHIDPTTCERDYSDDEIMFMRAMDEYKRKSGRMFPTWSEVLEVLHCLGYRRVEEMVELPAYKKS